ncbi:MAG: hypothetical protein IJX55_07995 [Clostridia bacterium]|nr:hypothetical protein [Clostridia bacterium]
MKKIVAWVLACGAALALCACGKKSGEVRFGMGAHAYYSAEKSASEEAAGYGKVIVAVAAVVTDENGKILACELDMAENKGEFTHDGKCVAASGFKTKGELGDGYGMKGASDIGKEWYEQAEAFENAAKGKTLDEVKTLLATGESEIVRAGCTIDTGDFIAAVEKAIQSAKSVSVRGDYDVEMEISSAQIECRDASETENGTNRIKTVFSAVLEGEDDTELLRFSDEAEAEFTFDAHGHAVFDISAELKTENEKK